MPSASTSGFNPREFVKLVAIFDTNNPSEAEAMNAARLMRRSLANNSLRFVDAIGRADVMQALDAQLQPVREESPELKAAVSEIAELEELAKIQEKIIDDLRQELSGQTATSSHGTASPVASARGLVNGALVAAVFLAAVLLLVLAAIR